MKIIVVSDTHGNNRPFMEAAMTIGKPDLMIHLGDYVSDAKKIAKVLDIDFVTVKGNGDYGTMAVNEDELIQINGKKLFLTHGHRYHVSFNQKDLYQKGLELGANLILFGHTHIPMVEKVNDIIIMNPGSPSIPRKWDKKRTFGLITIDEAIEIEIINMD